MQHRVSARLLGQSGSWLLRLGGARSHAGWVQCCAAWIWASLVGLRQMLCSVDAGLLSLDPGCIA
eukprot:scaffold200533_cov19-Tisochrysis_lutea.AAC.1